MCDPVEQNACRACGHSIAALQEFVWVDGQEIHLHRRFSEGATALWLIHGLGDWAETWRGVFTAPALEPWELIAPDLPGFGRSPVHSTRGVAVAELADTVGQLVEALTPDRRVVLVGHSLGGVLTTLLAEHKPDWLAGVVNIEGNLTQADCFVSGAAITASDPARWYEQFTAQVRADGARHAALRCYAQGLRQADQSTFLSCSRDLVRLCEDDELGNRYQALATTKLYCHGDSLSKESLYLLEHAGEAHQGFAGAGHWVQLDAVEELSEAVARWLTRLDDGRS